MTSPAKTIQDRNRELARQINEEALSNPSSPYAGKFVGIVRGQVAVVANDLDELGRAMDGIAVPPDETFCIEVGLDYDEPQFIWSAK